MICLLGELCHEFHLASAPVFHLTVVSILLGLWTEGELNNSRLSGVSDLLRRVKSVVKRLEPGGQLPASGSPNEPWLRAAAPATRLASSGALHPGPENVAQIQAV